ncbi:hypothetical protein ED733_001572 [Metarhizium rileyi]|uniref:Fungal lipase-type domain-containing protein n=1 Tax=Metarhizium rileyi (strain RCEF 4871) TaxID=1649241 RepID=A0A5C6G256_METRR|nr:hypothetical protein ED733_001572 [Metarhizium rileyi]
MLSITIGLSFLALARAESAQATTNMSSGAMPTARTLERGPSRASVSSETYEKLSYYAQFPTSAGSPCANPPSGLVEQLYISNNKTDTQAAIYRLDARKEFILAIPGTNGNMDVLTDLNIPLVTYNVATGPPCENCKAHTGFLNGWNSIATDVERGLESALQSYPEYTITIAGHSLGGALGELAFGSLKPKPLPVKQVLTYGAPRVGNREYADYIDSLSGASDSDAGVAYRVTHFDGQ